MQYVGNQNRARKWRENIGGLLAASAPFNPALVAGLLAWYDFSDPTTLFTDAGVTPVTADGDLIYQINDKSGNGRNQTQATGGNRATYKTNIKNGLSVGRGDGGDLYRLVTYSYNQPFTIFVVAMATGSASRQYFSGANNFGVGLNTSNRIEMYAGAYQVSANNKYVNGQYHLFKYEINGTSSKAYVDDVNVISANPGANNPLELSLFSLASINMLTGDYCEHLLYNGIVNVADSAYLTSGLNTKWGL